ncbi:DUF4350 domain-containing protein [Streptomyces tsukubensis]|uniref:DUF4350 domain-containing protein n=1 Tax=Streptomyces tsukubensis TaxID=83656 RepID=A0A1V3ZZY8_9ACTN|nr:DUF4350 domain-containing protein [Streptomyces tsukubensis]OON72129.1 hypothetical protein B1H18_31105 [Streptomyces tsukubensis]QFR93933.1 DUF4350 domain-containing protein [Streptomyces tsukubensis]
MTAEPSTSLAPAPRQVWTRTRGIVLACVVLLAAALAIALVRSGAQHGRLDPRSADPRGSRAAVELLKDRGVSTRVVTTLDEARRAHSPDTTLLVASPELLTARQQSLLRASAEGAQGRTVLVAPGSSSIGRLVPGVKAAASSATTLLSPGCDLPTARRAGPAETGGVRYSTHLPQAALCYLSDGLPTLLELPTAVGDNAPPGGNAAERARDGADQGDTVVLGAPDILYNNRLDKQGNASLALQLLGAHSHLVWYLPSSDVAPADGGDRSLFDLLPSGWLWGTLQLVIAAALAAVWRGRRLGPLVPENLPVAVRASETVEGRARLYEKANARERAATALRTAARTRLARLAAVPPSQAHSPEALLPALTPHLSSPHPGAPQERLMPLLFGPPPTTDMALVTLADQLDALEREVRTT